MKFAACASSIGIETEDARESRIAGHDRAVRFHDEIAGEIFIDETAITLLAATKRFRRAHAIGYVGVDLQPGRIRACIGQRPTARDHDLDAVAAGLPELAFPMVLGAESCLEPAERLCRAGFEQLVHVLPERFLALPAINPLRAAIPVGDRAVRVADDDRVAREIEQLRVLQKILPRPLEIALRVAPRLNARRTAGAEFRRDIS